MRFDVRRSAATTIESMRAAGARVLAIEADKTIVIDQEQPSPSRTATASPPWRGRRDGPASVKTI